MIHEDERLLDWFRSRGRCELCGRWLRHRAHPHHTFYHRGLGGGSRLDVKINLASLGGPWDCGCHDAIHYNGRARKKLKGRIAERERTTVSRIEAVLASILRAPAGTATIEELLGEMK